MRTHSIDISEKNGIRYLHFGSHWVQGAMRIKRPFDLELAYAQDMMFGLVLRAKPEPSTTPSWPRNVLQIGLGAGSLVKWCHRHLPETQVTAVEINPSVYAAARQFFSLPPDDDRLSVVLGDGVEFLQNSPQQWDLILLDGYDAEGRPGALDSMDFYTLCREKLSENGLLSINLLGLARTYEQSVDRITQAFIGNILILPACSSGNRVIFASKEVLPLVKQTPHLSAVATSLQKITGLNLHPLIDRIGH
jgi:spermidine synthase